MPGSLKCMAIVGRSAALPVFGGTRRSFGKREGECGGAAERNEPDENERPAPAAGFREGGGRQAPAHAPHRIARNIETHREPDRRTIHLFDQIGHRHGRNAGERKAGQRSKRDERRPVRRKGGGERRRRGGGQRRRHHRLAPERVRQRSGEDHRDRQHARRRRQGQARGGGRDRKGAGEARHQRLDAIEHREGREAAEKQPKIRAPEPVAPRAIRGASPAGACELSKSWGSTTRGRRLPACAGERQDKFERRGRCLDARFSTTGRRPHVRDRTIALVRALLRGRPR